MRLLDVALVLIRFLLSLSKSFLETLQSCFLLVEFGRELRLSVFGQPLQVEVDALDVLGYPLGHALPRTEQLPFLRLTGHLLYSGEVLGEGFEP